MVRGKVRSGRQEKGRGKKRKRCDPGEERTKRRRRRGKRDDTLRDKNKRIFLSRRSRGSHA